MSMTMDLLTEIRAAFPAAPYPGDVSLSDCRSNECEWSVRSLRGKSWMQLRVEDVGGDGAFLSVRAFRYYLPGLLCVALQHPDATHLASEINARFVVLARAPPAATEVVLETVLRLSLRQRGVIARFLLWLNEQGWQAPVLIEAALRAVRDGQVIPVIYEELMRWCRSRETSIGA
jgi:hypothetical protein